MPDENVPLPKASESKEKKRARETYQFLRNAMADDTLWQDKDDTSVLNAVRGIVWYLEFELGQVGYELLIDVAEERKTDEGTVSPELSRVKSLDDKIIEILSLLAQDEKSRQ
ncbi:MAG: hypothetical protein Q7S53_05120 [bacterium]|nr:hypothetical protein [bacterium]